MGQIFRAANRGEGYKLAARDGPLVIAIDIILWTTRTIFRFFSGRPMAGDRKRKTDATFTQPGFNLIHPKARPPVGWNTVNGFCWSRLPEWRRAAVRCSFLTVIITGPWAWYGHGTHALEAALLFIVMVGNWTVWSATQIYRKIRYHNHNRTLVNPIKKGVAPILGVPVSAVKLDLPLQESVKTT